MKNKEIAQLLKVSPATVSLALNDKPGVSEETRRKIFELKDSSLRNGIDQLSSQIEKGTIGLLVFKNRGDIIAETPFFVMLIEAIDQQASSNSFKLNITYTSSGDLQEYVEEINDSNLSGLLILATEATSKIARTFRNDLKIPFVMLDAYFPGDNVDSVLMDNRSGIKQAVEYGISMGHRKIGFLKSSQHCNNFADRYSSFKMEMEDSGIGFQDEYVFEIPATTEAARQVMQEILQKKVEFPTLLIAANDRIAMGAADALKDFGYKIPDDISIIGFDDMPMVQFLNPPLTSISLRQTDIARIAVNRLVDKMLATSESSQFSIQQFVEVSVVKRQSVKEIKY